MVSNNYMPAFIYNENHWTKLKDAITNSEAELVAIDSLNRLTGDSNGEEEVAKQLSNGSYAIFSFPFI